VLDPLVQGVPEKLELGKEAVKQGGLGIITAAIFLSGEMAGSGVLALPAAFIGTGGILGMILIAMFTINSGFSGTRLGLCWVMLEERIYCWVLIVLGIAGGVLATYMALNNIFNASMVSPCYLMEAGANITISSSH